MSPFQIHPLPFAATRRFSGLLLDYLSGKPQLDPFYTYKPEAASFSRALTRKTFTQQQRDLLTKVLQEQYQGTQLTEKVADNIAAFAVENTFCAVTAHQLNVLTGPLYVIYKAQSVIDLCNLVEQENEGCKMVPVFWLGSEDHDLPEINHIDLAGSHIEWNTQQQGPAGRMQTAGMEEMIREVQAATGHHVLAKEWLDTALKAYREANNLTAATRTLLHSLFGEQGLVVIDGDHPALKAQFASVMVAEIQEGVAGRLAKQTSADLAEHYGAQAYVRDINLFYMQDGLRERIERQGDSYSVLHTDLVFSQQELIEAIQKQPEAFSPNVILRPLYQQMVLPSLAYVGGGGELAYWLQLKGIFDHFETDFPILLLRSSVMVVGRKVAHRMQRLSVSNEAVFQSEQELVQHLLQHTGNPGMSFDAEKERITALFEDLKQSVAKLDPTLEKAAIAAGVRAVQQLEKLEKKAFRAAKRRSLTELNQLQFIMDDLFPAGHLQERHYNVTEMFARYGNDFLRQLEGKLNPLQHAFLIFEEGA
ncbi:MAG: hypothetical protein ABR95_13550 [Sphingobacteriales bacterium BACL12 MAG-120813-bin55]|jgi:bacillithiol synthase|nr:MAG: hypothetical protein ABR95_13550 [Sphingobacteriales bacterium BACL12 MAG-120813-bin55]